MRRQWKALVVFGVLVMAGCSGSPTFDPSGHWDLDVAITSASRSGEPVQSLWLDFARDGSFSLSELLVKGTWKVEGQKVSVRVSNDTIGLLDHFGIEKVDGGRTITFDWSSKDDRLLWDFYNAKAKLQRKYWFKRKRH